MPDPCALSYAMVIHGGNNFCHEGHSGHLLCNSSTSRPSTFPISPSCSTALSHSAAVGVGAGAGTAHCHPQATQVVEERLLIKVQRSPQCSQTNELNAKAPKETEFKVHQMKQN